MPIHNRLTRLLGIEHPILLAPMDLVSGGRLAAAVSHAGGLGLLVPLHSDFDRLAVVCSAWLARHKLGKLTCLGGSRPLRDYVTVRRHVHVALVERIPLSH